MHLANGGNIMQTGEYVFHFLENTQKPNFRMDIELTYHCQTHILRLDLVGSNPLLPWDTQDSRK